MLSGQNQISECPEYSEQQVSGDGGVQNLVRNPRRAEDEAKQMQHDECDENERRDDRKVAMNEPWLEVIDPPPHDRGSYQDQGDDQRAFATADGHDCRKQHQRQQNSFDQRAITQLIDKRNNAQEHDQRDQEVRNRQAAHARLGRFRSRVWFRHASTTSLLPHKFTIKRATAAVAVGRDNTTSDGSSRWCSRSNRRPRNNQVTANCRAESSLGSSSGESSPESSSGESSPRSNHRTVN